MVLCTNAISIPSHSPAFCSACSPAILSTCLPKPTLCSELANCIMNVSTKDSKGKYGFDFCYIFLMQPANHAMSCTG